MYIEQLIYDRTAQDLANNTSKAYIAYNDLNRVEGACVELATALGVTITTKTWTMSDWRTESEMERIRQNLITLKNAYYSVPGSPDVPSAITYTSITQANNIEKIIHDIYELYTSVEAGKNRLSFTLGRKALGTRG